MAVCKKCYWDNKGMVSGQAFTDFECALCGRTDMWHNTDVPKFCRECSEKFNMCQRCGADMEDERYYE